MGMYDTIYNVPAICPRCRDIRLKSVQIKNGPQILMNYEFGKTKIEVDWDYEYYGSIIDKEKRIIRGIATCDKCKEEANNKMEELIEEAKNRGELNCPEKAKFLVECKIGEKDALRVILKRVEEFYDGNSNIELFEVAILLDKDYIAIKSDPI